MNCQNLPVAAISLLAINQIAESTSDVVLYCRLTEFLGKTACIPAKQRSCPPPPKEKEKKKILSPTSLFQREKESGDKGHVTCGVRGKEVRW